MRFGSNIGVIWNDQGTSGDLLWRFRADADGLTSWNSAVTISTTYSVTAATFAAVGDTSGNIYLTANDFTTVYFNYWNGTVWSSITTVASSVAGNDVFASVATDGTNAWVFYGETTGLSAGLGGAQGRALVYKKGVPPFTASEFDSSSTAVVSQHGTFNKVWLYDASADTYEDETTDAGNTTNADVAHSSSSTILKDAGDIAYFGKTAKFDSISWDLSTNGVSCEITWEYYNGSSWMALTDFISIDDHDLDADGEISFIPHSDWATVAVNGEGTSYYYVRVRVTAGNACSTGPIGVQMAAIPLISGAGVIGAVASNATHIVWTENAASPTRVRYASVTTTASTAPSSTVSISPVVQAYSSATT